MIYSKLFSAYAPVLEVLKSIFFDIHMVKYKFTHDTMSIYGFVII